MDVFWNCIDQVNAVLWHDTVLFVVLGVGVLFTLWSGFGQYRALTHGVSVVRGRYDRPTDPGAINHFNALSTALSATVGLGNIAGVAIAISLGGPGAVFWMWVTGLVGMSLKMTEVTQAMLFRDLSDPANPRGGAMWVCHLGFAKLFPRFLGAGRVLGVLFSVTLLISAVTGGNMFQAWNVADISFAYFGVPRFVTGLVLAVLVGLVIVGGIRRIGDVAGKVVPFMCLAYILAGLVVLALKAGEIPGLFRLIFREAFAPSEAVGAFIGGAAGYGFLKGMQRALFSNEAGQGSAPIAHSAAKTDEPVREGIVAGLEPFIDTLCVCTITALVILLSGAWNREPALQFDTAPPALNRVLDAEGDRSPEEGQRWSIAAVGVHVANDVEARTQLREGTELFVVVEVDSARNGAPSNIDTGMARHRIQGRLERAPLAEGSSDEWLAVFDQRTQDEVSAHRPPYALNCALEQTPRLVSSGAFFDFKGATLTAKSFDRVLPGLGAWVVPIVVWLFAFSTIISWSYYGEQGIVYLFGLRATIPYRLIYCALVLVTTQLVRTQDELDVLSTLGTGAMLWVNIPIMLLFGPAAMRAYRDYCRRLRSGEMLPVARSPSRSS